MGRLAGFSSREVIRVAESTGWVLVRTEGDHFIFRKAGVRWTLTIPLRKDLGEGLVRKLIRQMGLTVDDFLALARK
ncbi:MAG: type II toxin-antitoxin system HicA family toxin [Hyphomicrobiales bacterium]